MNKPKDATKEVSTDIFQAYIGQTAPALSAPGASDLHTNSVSPFDINQPSFLSDGEVAIGYFCFSSEGALEVFGDKISGMWLVCGRHEGVIDANLAQIAVSGRFLDIRFDDQYRLDPANTARMARASGEYDGVIFDLSLSHGGNRPWCGVFSSRSLSIEDYRVERWRIHIEDGEPSRLERQGG